MAMLNTFYNAVANYGGTLITYIGLVDETGVEISGGSYARQSASWGGATSGSISLASDLTFEIPAGNVVAGWRCFNAETGGTNYGGGTLTQESYTGDGTYTLLASSTSITISSS